MKYFISLLSISTLILFASLVFASQTAHTFGDVGDTHANMPAIEYLVSIGTVEGYSDGTFKPANTVNRAEIMKILVKGQGIDPDPAIYKNCFPDVKDEWFASSICYAEAQGWVSGYPDQTFKPGNTVNKVEAIKMLVNALGLTDRLSDTVTETLFSDTNSGQWYAPYLKVAKDLNLLEVTSGNFNPSGGMNRAGVAENIFRTLIVKDNAFTPYTEANRNAFMNAAGLDVFVGSQATFTPISTYKSFELTARQFEFSPSIITVQEGDTVHLTIASEDVSHGFYLPEFNVSETINSNQPVEIEFVANKKGTFTFSCNVFCGAGHSHMTGTLIVE